MKNQLIEESPNLSSTKEFGTSGEQGVVLILLAMLAGVLCMCVALVIDLTRYSNSREQSEHYARLISLAAIEGHFGAATTANPDPSIQERVQAALLRAQQASALNVSLGEPSKHVDLQTSLEPGVGALLEPGIWYFSKPAATDPDPDPCLPVHDTNSDGVGDYPCFVPVDLATATKVTAYRVTGKLYSSISTSMARGFFNVDSLPVNVFSTATVMPRHIAFAVDLSGSMIRETHLLRPKDSAEAGGTTNNQTDTPFTGRGSEFAFCGDVAECPVNASYHIPHWQFLNTPDSSGRYRRNDWDSSPGDGVTDNLLGTPMTSITADSYQKVHFADDYVKKYALENRHYTAARYPLHPAAETNPIPANMTGGSTHTYEVDIFRDDGTKNTQGYTYSGPQPLTTVFVGLRAALTMLKNRQVAGDKAALMFYDERLSWPRVVKLTDNLDYLLKLTDTSIPNGMTNDPLGFNNNTSGMTDVNTQGLELLVRHGLYPSGESSSFTDTIEALSYAVSELYSGNPTGKASSDAVVSITDGLLNCRTCLSPGTPAGCTLGCSNQFSYFSQARNDLYNWVNTSMLGKNLPIHWIILGNSVQPHTLDVTLDPDANGRGPCIGSAEAVANKIPAVRGGCSGSTCTTTNNNWDTMSTSNPFYEGNVMPFEVAQATAGLYGPIRPSPPGCVPYKCSGRVTAPGVTNPPNPARVSQDPDCRSVEDQIIGYMEKIVGDNPYTLVQEQ